MAILPFTDGPNSVGSGNSFTGLVLDRVMQNGRMNVVERSHVAKILEEKRLQASDLVIPEKAVEVGGLVGVDAFILGFVSQYDSDKTVVYFHVVPVVGWKNSVETSVRIIDVTDGAVVYSFAASASSGRDLTDAGRQCAEHLLKPLTTVASASARKNRFAAPWRDYMVFCAVPGTAGRLDL